MFRKVKVETTVREGLVNITDAIQEVVRKSGIEEGICILYVPIPRRLLRSILVLTRLHFKT